jgi:hypothetical protein
MRLMVLICAAAASCVALAQGAPRAMTKQEFIACEREHFVRWQVDDIVVTLDRIDALKSQGGKENEIAPAERRLANARSKRPIDFWWDDGDAEVATIAAADLAVAERGQRAEHDQVSARRSDQQTPEGSLGYARSAARACMYDVRLEFLKTGKVRPAKVRRPLTRAEVSSACGPQLARAQEANLRALPPKVDKLRKQGANPRRFPLYGLERELTGAQSKSAIDHFWEDTGGFHYVAKIAGGDISDAAQRIRTNKRLVTAIETGDRNTYSEIMSGNPPAGLDREQMIAALEAQTCVLELREQFQRTGKLPAAR